MISCKIVSYPHGYELNTDISQKSENCVIIRIEEGYFEKLKNENAYKAQKELEFLFGLHTGRL